MWIDPAGMELAGLQMFVFFGYVLFEFCVNGDAISSLERSRTWRATGCQNPRR